MPTRNEVKLFFRKAALVLQIYGESSSMHGFYHLFQSTDIVRRIFWLIALLSAMSFGIFHTVESLKRYGKLDVFIQVQDEAEPASFPSITICRIKPFSESLLVHYAKVLDRHFEDKWSYFDHWFPNERLRRPNESDVAYKYRLLDIYSRLMQIVWASEDSRDLGMFFESTILACKYEGRRCDSANFTLIRDPDSWYCYTFSPSKDIPISSLGLELDMFTDSSFYNPIHYGSVASLHGSAKLSELPPKDNASMWNSLRYLLTHRNRSWNQITVPKITRTDGFRVIVHDHDTHPMLSLNRLEVETNVAASIRIDQMYVKRLQRRKLFDCALPPYKTVRYVTYFESDRKLEHRTFNKLQDDHVVEAKQSMVMNSCGCYSHRYPFETAVEKLCYYSPLSERRMPSKALMERVTCHDRIVMEEDKKTFHLLQKFSEFAPCNYNLLAFSNNVYSWPKNVDMSQIVNTRIMDRFSQGDTLLPTDGREHPIFNFSDPNIVKLVPNGKIVSLQAIILLQLFNSTDAEFAVFNRSHWRLDSNERLSKNLLRLNIRMQRKMSRLTKEHHSYLWPEALSEIGGICGLWLGISALTFFELAEFVYQIFTSNVDVRTRSEVSSYNTEMIEDSISEDSELDSEDSDPVDELDPTE